MRNLKVEIELKRERELLMSAKVFLVSMSDADFREYCVRSSQYLSAFSAYTSHLTYDELQQFDMLRSVNMPSKGMKEDVVVDGTCEMPSGDLAEQAPAMS